jgi:hypothetical protein
MDCKEEMVELVANCDRFGSLKHSSTLSLAFTEYCAVMTANILNSQVAIDAYPSSCASDGK